MISSKTDVLERQSLSEVKMGRGSPAEHVSGAERGASAERSVRNIVGARSGFLSKGRSDHSVSLLFRSDTAHTTSLGHAQIHPEFTCAFNN